METHGVDLGLDGSLASAIVAALTNTVLIIDEMSRLLYVTSDSDNILGQAPDYWIGRSSLDFVHPEDLDAVVGHIKDAFTSVGTKRRFANIRIGSGGQWIPTEAVGFNRLSFDGTPALLISIRDTTGELRVAQARRRADRTIAAQGMDHGSIVADEVVSTLLDSLRPTQKILLVDVALLNVDSLATPGNPNVAHEVIEETKRRVAANHRDHDIALQVEDNRFLVIMRDVDNTRTAYQLAARIFELCDQGACEMPCDFQVGFALASAGDDFAAVRAYAAQEGQFRSTAKPDAIQQQFS